MKTPREQHMEKFADWCKNYNGMVHEKCKADVIYYSIVPLENSLNTLPCFKKNNAATLCAKCEFPTPEEVVADADEFEEKMNRFAMVHRAAKDDAKAKGLKRGHGGVSSLPCPTKCGGALQYSVASYNGHMHACCTTKGCMSWME